MKTEDVVKTQKLEIVEPKAVYVEGEEHSLEEGDIVRLRERRADKWVNHFDFAKYIPGEKEAMTKENYRDSDLVVSNEKKSENDSGDGKSDEEKFEEWIRNHTVEEMEKKLEDKNDEELLESVAEVAERKGVKKAAEERLEELREEDVDGNESDEEKKKEEE